MLISGRKYINVNDKSIAIAIEESIEFSGHFKMYDVQGTSYFYLESNDWNKWVLID